MFWEGAGPVFSPPLPCDVTKRINKVSIADRFGRGGGEGPADILTTSIFKSLIAKVRAFSVLSDSTAGQSTKGDSH